MAKQKRVQHSQHRPTILSKKRKLDESESNEDDERRRFTTVHSETSKTKRCRGEQANNENEEGSTTSYSQDQMVYLTPPSCCCSQMDSSHKETEEVDRPHQWPVYFKDEHSQSFSSNFSLPSLNWADSKEVWKIMLAKEHRYPREKEMLKKHPALQARMRAILLDWLTEVCEVYQLHRETYYLTMDFIDRYLASNRNIPKQQLQLIGITSLFMAAKLEEIYPPKLTDFAFVTDGACTDDEILKQELIMLKALQWELTPMTPNSWLNIYMQLSSIQSQSFTSDDFIIPNYSGSEFVKVAQLIDLCTLDIECLQFSYHVIAASALYHMISPEVFHLVTGIPMKDADACVSWLAPFALTIKEVTGSDGKCTTNSLSSCSYNIQTHSVNLELLERAQQRQMQILSSPSSPLPYSGILTPPPSKEKQSASEC